MNSKLRQKYWTSCAGLNHKFPRKLRTLKVQLKQQENKTLTNPLHTSLTTLTHFLSKLCETIVSLQDSKNVNTYGSNIHKFILGSITSDTEFVSLLPRQHCSPYEQKYNINRQNLTDELFDEVCSLFSRVMLKQLRRDFMAEMKRRKALAHRKQVLKTKEDTENSKNICQVTLHDLSIRKHQSHIQLQQHATTHRSKT